MCNFEWLLQIKSHILPVINCKKYGFSSTPVQFTSCLHICQNVLIIYINRECYFRDDLTIVKLSDYSHKDLLQCFDNVTSSHSYLLSYVQQFVNIYRAKSWQLTLSGTRISTLFITLCLYVCIVAIKCLLEVYNNQLC